MSHCDHAFDYPAHELIRIGPTDVICPACARQCDACGEKFYFEDVMKVTLKNSCGQPRGPRIVYYCKACYSIEVSILKDEVEYSVLEDAESAIENNETVD